MSRNQKSIEEKLEELNVQLIEEQLKVPLGINARVAELSYRIWLLKKSIRINMPEEQHRLIGSLSIHF